MNLTLTKSSVIHPILFGMFPILLLASVNMDEIVFDDVLLPFLIIVPTVFILWYSLNLFLKNKMKSGLIVSLGTVLFFSYGHFFNILNGIDISGFDFVRHRYFLPLFFGIFVLGTYSLLKTQKNLVELTTIVNVIAFVIVILSVFNISVYAFENNPEELDSQINYDSLNTTLDYYPNVYYIILDEYANSKVLKDIYNFDNSDFLLQLEKRGFDVAKDSHSNYAATFLSLTSSLNMQYLNYLSDDVGKESSDRTLANRLFDNNKVMNIFKYYNYTIVNLTLNPDSPKLADYDLCLGQFYTDPFQITLWESTILKPIFVTMFADQAHRDKILCKFSELSNLHNSIEEPYFVYAHLQFPHPPYVFGPNGEAKDTKSLSAGASAWDNKLGYINQVQFANKKTIETIDKILDESTMPPIIILQGDHGTPTLLGGGGLNWNNVNDESIRERMSIFNAYYLPNQDLMIDESITPINSFRLVFNNYFNGNYTLLENRNYFSDYKHPYDFTDVTKILMNDAKD